MPPLPKKNRKRRNRKKKKKQSVVLKESPSSQDAEGQGKESGADAAVEIEYVTEEPEIYDPNFIFFKRIFEAFKVRRGLLWVNLMLLGGQGVPS